MRNSRTLIAATASVAVAALLVLAPAGSSSAAQPPHGGTDLRLAQQPHSTLPSAQAQAAVRASWAQQLKVARASTPRAVARLDPALSQLAGVPGATRSSNIAVSADGTVDVSVSGSGAAAAVAAIGGRVLARFGGQLSASVRPSQLQALAARPNVSQVAKTTRALPLATSEGVLTSGARNWADNGNLGNGGAGVQIAIVDAGFGGLQAERDAGHFDDPAGDPATIVYGADQNHCDNDGATDHGTAVAEIVHQMAPRASLYLYCVDDNVGFSQSAGQVVTAGIKIATSSLGFIAESRGDGSGGADSTELAVKNARDNGVLWIQSAGNSAQDHWSGKLADANGDEAVDLLSASDTGESDFVYLDPKGVGSIVLSWDQWPTSNLPISLGVAEFDSNGNPVGSPVIIDHTAGDDPTIEFDPQNNSTTAGDYHIYQVSILEQSPSPTVRYDLTYSGDVYPSYLSTIDPVRAAAGSVTEPATSPSALAVGASYWLTNGLEAFSSRGPTIDGRVKPDLLGFDGVSSNISDVEVSNGVTTGFFGTSAAAPHVAGAAALALANDPTLTTPASLQAFLQARANPNVNPPNNTAGAGLLQLANLSGTPGCTARTTLPARVLIDRPLITITAPITTTCTTYHAAAALQGSAGTFDSLGWTDDNTSSSAHFDAQLNTPGTYAATYAGGVSDQGAIAFTGASTTLKYVTLDYIASSRQRSAVYINGLLKNYSKTAAGLVRGVGRVAYLQRYLNGAWQNVLSRTGDSTGQFAVGFIQNTVYQYRLVTPETGTAWNGASGSTFR